MRLLPFQVENRRKLVDQRTALSHQLTDLLKLYYPPILLWFPDITTLLVGDLLLRWPTLRELQKAKAATREKFFQQHMSFSETSNGAVYDETHSTEAR